MLLKQLLEGVQRSKFILIQDSVNEDGSFLLKEFMKANVKRNKVHLLCFEQKPQFFESYLEENESGIMKIYDIEKDPKGWIKDQDKNGKSKYEEINIFHKIRASTEPGDKHPVVIIDSLSSALVLVDLHLLYKQVHQLLHLSLAKDIIALQVIAIIHKDYLIDGDVGLLQFQHLASSIVNIEYNGHSGFNVTTTLKKPNGKLLKEVCSVYLAKNNNLVMEEIKDIQSSTGVVDKSKDITGGLTTFKLHLGVQEKEARKQLVLPYLKTEEQQSAGGGNIYYEPDARDDWDEEDPDDDLDI